MTPLGHGVERGAKDAVGYLFYCGEYDLSL